MTRHATDPAEEARTLLVFNLQWVRGLAILAVVAIHTTPGAMIRLSSAWVVLPFLFANYLARFAVPVFVLISGFHLSLNERNERPRQFYRRTLKFLLVPYALYTLVYSLLHAALLDRGGPWAMYAFPERAVLLSFWNLAHASAEGPFWFIPVIIELYLLHPFLRKAYRRANRPLLVILTAFVVQTVFGVADEAYKTSIRATEIGYLFDLSLAFLPLLGYFLLGYYARDHADALLAFARRRAGQMLALAAWLVSAASLVAYWFLPIPWTRWAQTEEGIRAAIAMVAPALSVGAFVLMLAWLQRRQASGRVGRFVSICGLYAYGVFYLHPLVIIAFHSSLLTAFRVRLGLPGRITVETVLAIVLSVAAAKALSRLPYAKYLA